MIVLAFFGMFWLVCGITAFIAFFIACIHHGRISVYDLSVAALVLALGPLSLFVIIREVFWNCRNKVIWQRGTKK